jgi:hypothetical protein
MKNEELWRSIYSLKDSIQRIDDEFIDIKKDIDEDVDSNYTNPGNERAEITILRLHTSRILTQLRNVNETIEVLRNTLEVLLEKEI